MTTRTLLAAACLSLGLGLPANVCTAGEPPSALPAAGKPEQPVDPILITCQLVEIPFAAATAYFGDRSAMATRDVTPEVLNEIIASAGADVLSAPRITALPGQPAQVKIVQERAFTTGFKSDAKSGEWEPVIEKKEIGISLKVTATPYPSDPARLHGTLELSSSKLLGIMQQKVNPPGQAAPLLLSQPTIATRSLATAFDLYSGKAAVLGTLETQSDTATNAQRRVLLVLLTAENTSQAAVDHAGAKRLIFPKIEFEKATLQQVAAFIRKRSQELDPDAEGVNLVLELPPRPLAAGDNDADPVTIDDLPAITLSLNNIPLSELLRYVAAATGMTVRYDTNAIVLTPK